MLNYLLNFANTYVVPFGLRFICGILILLIGFKLTKLFIKAIKKSKFFSKLDSNVQSLIKTSLKVLLNTLVVILAIEVLGVPSATILAVLGSCGLAVGLALQGGLSNLAGGFIIMIFKPFMEGDFISTPMGDGTVEKVGVFYTRLTSPDNVVINIPNSTLSNSNVSNYSVKNTRRVDIDVAIAYEADIDLAKKVLLATAESYDNVLGDPAPVVFVVDQADSSVALQLRVWVNSADYWAVKFGLVEDTKKTLDKFNIAIPYPQLDVHVKND